MHTRKINNGSKLTPDLLNAILTLSPENKQIMSTYLDAINNRFFDVEKRSEGARFPHLHLHALSMCHVDYRHTNAGRIMGLSNDLSRNFDCNHVCPLIQTTTPVSATRSRPIHRSRLPTARAPDTPYSPEKSPIDQPSIDRISHVYAISCETSHASAYVITESQDHETQRFTQPLHARDWIHGKHERPTVEAVNIDQERPGIPQIPITLDNAPDVCHVTCQKGVSVIIDLMSPSKQYMKKIKAIKTRFGRVPRIGDEIQRCMTATAFSVIMTTVLSLWICWKYVIPHLFNHYT